MIHYKYKHRGSCNWLPLFYCFITIIVVVFEHCNSNSSTSFFIIMVDADDSTCTSNFNNYNININNNNICISQNDENTSNIEDSSCVGIVDVDVDVDVDGKTSVDTNKISRILLTSSGLVTKSMQLNAKKMYKESLNIMQQQQKRSQQQSQQQPIILYIVDAALEPIQYNFNTNHNNDKIKQSRIVQQMERSMQREWDKIIIGRTTSTSTSTSTSTNTEESTTTLTVPKIIGIELATIQDNNAANDEILLNNNIIGIYLEQGNTYYLLYQLRRTKFDSVIEDLVNVKNGFIVGASAGSIVCGTTIQTCEIKNWDDPGHNTFWDCTKQSTKVQGLNLLHNTSLVGTSVFPHYNSQWDTRIQQMIQYYPNGIIILNEEQYYIQGITTPINPTELRGRIEQ